MFFVELSAAELKPRPFVCQSVCVCASMRAPGPYNINLLPHLCFLAFKGHGRPGAVCVCLSVCVSVCVTGEAMVRKGMWQQSHTQGPPPTGPQGLNYRILHTHTHRQTHTHTLFTEGHWVPVSLVTCVCNHHPPPSPCHDSSPSILSLIFPDTRGFQNKLEKKHINEININILRRWQAWKLKRGDATLAICQKEMSLELNGRVSPDLKLPSVCVRGRDWVCVFVSAVCSDQTHWCVIGSPLSRWPLRSECLSWRRTGGGRTEDDVLQTTLTHTYTVNTLVKWHKCVERLRFSLCICMCVCVCVCVCVLVCTIVHARDQLSLPLLSCL